MEDDKIVSIREKPILNFLVNAGQAILSPSALDIIPEDDPYCLGEVISNEILYGGPFITYNNTFCIDRGRSVCICLSH